MGLINTDKIIMVSLDYTYDKGNLVSVTRGGFYNSTDAEDKIYQTYSFTYNDYGQRLTTSVEGRTLSENTYDASGNLASMTYGNGDECTYTYDGLDRVKTATHTDTGDVETYYYDNNSNVSRITETNNGETVREYKYEYDSLGRLQRLRETVGGETVEQLEYTYDAKNRLVSFDYYDGVSTNTVTSRYNDANGTLTKYIMDSVDESISYNYDSLNRVISKNRMTVPQSSDEVSVPIMQTVYNYKAGEQSGQTTNLVSRMRYNLMSGGLYDLNYTYDNLGNITEITDEDGNTLGRYKYDDMNQLVYEEIYEGTTCRGTKVYTYDTFGNIRKETTYSSGGFDSVWQAEVYGTQIDSVEYEYISSSSRDIMIKYDGEAMLYDGLGNPTGYYNGEFYSFAWQEGRQLASTSVYGGASVSYEYNSDGVRTSKTVNGKKTEYRLCGTQVVEMIRPEAVSSTSEHPISDSLPNEKR